MPIIKRIIKLKLPKNQSAFLWGARKTGKSTFLKTRFPKSLVYDFLDTDLFFAFSKRPALFREQLLAKHKNDLKNPIILDEVQKVPQILDEVHWLIENKNLSFILCGSSARKLKRTKANLLGGRAWRFEMFPLVTAELKKIDLFKILNRGMIPSHYLDKNYKKSLTSYVHDYLKEEVFGEGIIRNIPAFSRFFDAMGYSHGELINYSNIARDSGVQSKTVKEYYQILIDTLLGTLLEPFKKNQSRKVITSTPKFYLFDVGIAGAITNRKITELKGDLFGKAFEHFIFTELKAFNSYNEIGFAMNFWRTKSGLEVDFILGNGEVAIEVKSSSNVAKRDFRSLKTFNETYSPRMSIIVCNEKVERTYGQIRVMPYSIFLRELWEGKIIE